MTQRRTDLAVEAHQLWQESAAEAGSHPGVTGETGEREGFPATVVTILNDEGARALGKGVGRYVTLELEGLLRREEDAFHRAVRAIAHEVEELVPRHGTALVVGLGNRAVTPDTVGPLAVEHTLVTRHLVEGVPEHFGDLRPVAALAPGVLANTGIESSALTAALCERLGVSCVVAVDALASRAVERMCRTVQLTDTGIAPGSGVGNHRLALDQKSLGVPVVAVGVPTVVDAATLCLDLLYGEDEASDTAGPEREKIIEKLSGCGGDLFVTPREVDSRVADLGKVIGYGVSMGLNPALSVDELVMLLE